MLTDDSGAKLENEYEVLLRAMNKLLSSIDEFE
jgi:hypothetical protein